MSAGTVHLAMEDSVATVTFDRPDARNAMTWAMYEALDDACRAISADAGVRVAVFRGAGGTFVSGTDIAQFTSFSGPEAGLEYEARINACVARLEALSMPTLAVVEGAAMGGGLALASACDFRIATPEARFGVPIARTVGNCLSTANVARLVAGFGAPRTKRLLMLADILGADEAMACGFVMAIVESEAIDREVAAVCGRLVAHAPITMRVSKEAVRRILTDGLPPDDDLIATAYGSRDFTEGVAAFLAKRKPQWMGR